MSNRGIEIVYLNRTGMGERFDMASPIQLELENLDAFIHLAWDWSESYAQGHKNNIKNILPFLNSLVASKTKMVLLSSESASGIPGSGYGKLKRELEREFSIRGGSSVRAGLLWGSKLSGIVATVCRLSQLPFFCAHLNPDPSLFVSNEAEIAKALVSEAVSERTSHPVLSLKSIERIKLSKISHKYQGSNRKRFHLSFRVESLVSIGEFLSKLHIKLPFRVDSLRSLLAAQQDAPETGVKERITATSTEDFISWLTQSGSNRH
jgi:hypothetical protein